MDSLIPAMVVGGVAGGLGVLLVALLMPRRSCPECNTALPRFRKPANGRKAVLGGWTCGSCAARVGRDGTLLRD